MHALRLGVAMLMFGLAVGQEARAGIYNLDEPKTGWVIGPSSRDKGNPLPPKQVRLWRAELANAHDLFNPEEKEKDDKGQPKPPAKPKSPLRLAYEKQLAELEQRGRDGKLSPADRVSLSGCLLRLGRVREAKKVLEEGLRTLPEEEPIRFLLLLNLATAEWENEDLRLRAIDKQTEALRVWPERWKDWGWDRATWEWYRWAEKYNLALMRLRQREIGQPGLGPDALFPRLRFTGPTGQYEAGSIALDQWNELPHDAEQLVTQLMIWQPRDPRLYWLYGELLNARGDVLGAYEVFDYLRQFEGGGGFPELVRHRRVLLEAQEEIKKDANEEVGVFVPPPPPPEYPMPDWRALTIGFLVGVVVTVLSVFQLREWRRRAPVAPPPGPPAEWDRTDLPPPIGSPDRDGSEATGITRPTREEGPRV